MKNLKKNIIPIVGVIICSLILISLSKFIFKGGFLADKYNKGMEYYKGEVVEVLEENLQEDEFLENVQVGFQTVLVQLKDGPLKGQEYEIGNPVSRLYNIKVKEGTKVIVGCYESNGENVFTIFSYNRSNIIYILVAIFALIVIIIGGVKGVKSLVSLIFTLVCCVYLMLPLLLKGVSPIIAGILMAILSITVTLLLVGSGIFMESKKKRSK